jgi:hypothetical protein
MYVELYKTGRQGGGGGRVVCLGSTRCGSHTLIRQARRAPTPVSAVPPKHAGATTPPQRQDALGPNHPASGGKGPVAPGGIMHE